MTKSTKTLPGFDELPLDPAMPPHSAWGLFGADDRIGTLNLLTAERVLAAAGLVTSGEVFALNWDLELPDPPLFGRPAMKQTIHRRRRNVFDDQYDQFNTQSSSQWDGLRHFGHPEHGFYNGVTEEQISDESNPINGIDVWARRGIAGRGVLVDFARYAEATGLDYSPGERYAITAAEIEAAAAWQGTRFETGDILLLRTGWISWYSSLSIDDRRQLARPGELKAAGLEQSEGSLRFLWDNHFAAIAGDHPSFEAWPPQPPTPMMHETIIGLWGMPIGEMFQLDPLATACAADRRYQFLLTSAPLNKRGGVASPPNAIAIR